MIQGAGSNVGKSMIVAGLCRAFKNQGLRVMPFKPQNMSNNAAVTADGGEIGRAQALQAMACGVPPLVDMNPVLLKPETDVGAQVIVQGERLTTVKARDYAKLKTTLLPRVMDSFDRLSEKADLVIVEGAGSPAETNLRAGDIANMGFAEAANTPVILVGDIDRGGVIAQLVGTHTILPADDLARIKGFMVNKFRGDVSLFDGGLAEIIDRTGWSSLGVLPWFADAGYLPAEDASDIQTKSAGSGFKIVVPKLSRIANFDDLDPLSSDPNISVEMIEAGRPLPLDADLILIPGSKSTIGDLKFFRAQGWDIDLAAHVRAGGQVLGICGGYQMLGREIIDADGIEGSAGRYQGLGHLDIVTHMKPEKRLAEVSGTDIASGTQVTGYEIHIGQTEGADCDRAWLDIDGKKVGASSGNGRIHGCYIHGLFSADAFRHAYLTRVGASVPMSSYSVKVEETLEALASHMERHCDLDKLLEIASGN
jgi:adenosylcobyric acid synthase